MLCYFVVRGWYSGLWLMPVLIRYQLHAEPWVIYFPLTGTDPVSSGQKSLLIKERGETCSLVQDLVFLVQELVQEVRE